MTWRAHSTYALAAARVLVAARPFTAWISCKDERVRVKTLQIAIGNGRHYGGGNVVEESAEIDDGQLDLYSLELKSVLKLAMMLPSFRKGPPGTRCAQNATLNLLSKRGRSGPSMPTANWSRQGTSKFTAKPSAFMRAGLAPAGIPEWLSKA